MDALERIARTLLYEGYVLWPYRRSAKKNQQRWTFGGVHPKVYSVSSGGTDRQRVQTEVLFEVDDARANDKQIPSIGVSVRFLHVVARQVMRVERHLDSSGCNSHVTTMDFPVGELVVAGQRYLSWDEATERTINLSLTVHEGFRSRQPVLIPAGTVRESLFENGVETAAIVRSWGELVGTISMSVTSVGASVFRIGVTVANDSELASTERDEAVRHTLVSTHVVFQSANGKFVSQFDPPAHFRVESAANKNEGLWAVLVGDELENNTVLASPIILYDYPKLAPESPGDLFDGGEIDQLLILNILSLTEEEQREMRDSDPRAREILERCHGLTEEDLMRLHGTVRAMQPMVLSHDSAHE